MGKKYSDKTKNKKPWYSNYEGKVEVKSKIKEDSKLIVIKKFQLGIDKNNEPIITIDNTMHFMNAKVFHAFTLGIININKKINPEIDYSKILCNQDK